MSLRVKAILIATLLLLALATTIIAATATYQAFQQFQQQKMLVAMHDVRTIRPWMTIPYVAHVYHVPESYLYRSLHINEAHPPRHVTLQTLATHSNRSTNDLISDIQRDILTYRKQHQNPSTPTAQNTHQSGNAGRRVP